LSLATRALIFSFLIGLLIDFIQITKGGEESSFKEGDEELILIN